MYQIGQPEDKLSFLTVWRNEEHKVKTSLTSLCRHPQGSQVGIHERDYSQV